MKIVGLTGGIGSGKSFVSKMFKQKGIAVYDSDFHAKELMNSNFKLKKAIIELFGPESYNEKGLNRLFLASIVFSDNQKLEQLNDLVHPYVQDDFSNWILNQTGPYVIQEAAILFETGSYKKFDRKILVIAPKELRIERVVNRDGAKISEVQDRMNRQWEDKRKVELADYVVQNIDSDDTKSQVETIHQLLLEEFQ